MHISVKNTGMFPSAALEHGSVQVEIERDGKNNPDSKRANSPTGKAIAYFKQVYLHLKNVHIHTNFGVKTVSQSQ